MMFNHLLIVIGLVGQHIPRWCVPPPPHVTIIRWCQQHLILLIGNVEYSQDHSLPCDDVLLLLDVDDTISLLLHWWHLHHERFRAYLKGFHALSTLRIHHLHLITPILVKCYTINLGYVDDLRYDLLELLIRSHRTLRVELDFILLGFDVVEDGSLLYDVVGELLPLQHTITVEIDLLKQIS